MPVAEDDFPFVEFTPPEAYESNVVNMPGVEPRPPLELVNPAQWKGMQAPPRRWIVDGMVPYGQATLLTGAGSVGKSLVVQLQCTCIALGLPWLGTQVERANAIYISCEDDIEELWRRQEAICEGLGVNIEILDGKLHLLSLAGKVDNELATFDERGRIMVAGRFRDIEDAAKRVEARFVALDNTGHFYSGNENDRHQVASFVNIVNGLAARIDGAVVILGHPNKAGGEYSGSTAWENQVRSRLFMETPCDDDGNIPDPDARVIRKGKANYSQKGEEMRFRWHKWTFILDGDLPTDQRAELAANAQSSYDNEVFLHCLAVRNAQHRAVSENRASRTYAPKEFALMAESKGVNKARLEQAMDRLFRIGAVERSFLWREHDEGKDRYGLKATGINSADLPLTYGATNSADLPADLPPTSADPRKSYRRPNSADLKNEIPLTVPPTSADIRKTLPPTSADLSADTPLPLKGEGLRPSPHRGDTEPDLGEPPAWMDEAPPIDDWTANPILNRDWEDFE